MKIDSIVLICTHTPVSSANNLQTICCRRSKNSCLYISDPLPCSPDNLCGSGGKCLVDPLFPKKGKCRCEKGYHVTKDGKCTGRF